MFAGQNISQNELQLFLHNVTIKPELMATCEHRSPCPLSLRATFFHSLQWGLYSGLTVCENALDLCNISMEINCLLFCSSHYTLYCKLHLSSLFLELKDFQICQFTIKLVQKNLLFKGPTIVNILSMKLLVLIDRWFLMDRGECVILYE